MKKFLLYFVFLSLYSSISFGQVGAPGFIQDIKGQPIEIKSTTNVIGSPFLYDDWKNADVKMSGVLYKAIPIKLDLIQNKIYFKDQDGTTKLFPQPIEEFSINSNGIIEVYRKGFPKTGAWTNQTYYNVLYDGTTKLVQKINKYEKETREYNSATTVSKIIETKIYYVQKGNQLEEIKLNKKSIFEILKDKQNEVQNYVGSNKIDFGKHADVAKIFAYYDSL